MRDVWRARYGERVHIVDLTGCGPGAPTEVFLSAPVVLLGLPLVLIGYDDGAVDSLRCRCASFFIGKPFVLFLHCLPPSLFFNPAPYPPSLPPPFAHFLDQLASLPNKGFRDDSAVQRGRGGVRALHQALGYHEGLQERRLLPWWQGEKGVVVRALCNDDASEYCYTPRATRKREQ